MANRSGIEIAKTIIHESIHAKLRRHLQVGQNSFEELYGLYILNTTGSDELSHAIMRDQYVKNIANVLYQYDGGTEPMNYYEDLAWEGLDQYLPSSEIDQIIQSINLARSKGLDCE
ncbi:hypothetical protein [Robertkochia flava]|uniref:hypothetical protein n=1 Tax=Robertkochia flava TaxID=3447986 RepID=UPI001CCB8B11|nr:hypothetical protein [Robertkochia marina]